MLRTILAIAGKPGLYRLLSQGRNMLIVETLDSTKKRLPVYAADKVTSLGDISMYTDEDDIPLAKVLTSLKEKQQGTPVTLDYKKASLPELQEFFAQVLPNFDRDRVHSSDIKKLISWYNLLVAAGLTDFEEVAEEQEEAAEERAKAENENRKNADNTAKAVKKLNEASEKTTLGDIAALSNLKDAMEAAEKNN